MILHFYRVHIHFSLVYNVYIFLHGLNSAIKEFENMQKKQNTVPPKAIRLSLGSIEADCVINETML